MRGKGWHCPWPSGPDARYRSVVPLKCHCSAIEVPCCIPLTLPTNKWINRLTDHTPHNTESNLRAVQLDDRKPEDLPRGHSAAIPGGHGLRQWHHRRVGTHKRHPVSVCSHRPSPVAGDGDRRARRPRDDRHVAHRWQVAAPGASTDRRQGPPLRGVLGRLGLLGQSEPDRARRLRGWRLHHGRVHPQERHVLRHGRCQDCLCE